MDKDKIIHDLAVAMAVKLVDIDDKDRSANVIVYYNQFYKELSQVEDLINKSNIC